LYSANYTEAIRATDVLVQPRIPFMSHIPSLRGLADMICAGEKSALVALRNLSSKAA
jgi:hypothetical protein